MRWTEFCLSKAEECELRATDPTLGADMAYEWRLMAADWRAAASANDDGEAGEARPP
jgi:hypothetical protein